MIGPKCEDGTGGGRSGVLDLSASSLRKVIGSSRRGSTRQLLLVYRAGR